MSIVFQKIIGNKKFDIPEKDNLNYCRIMYKKIY